MVTKNPIGFGILTGICAVLYVIFERHDAGLYIHQTIKINVTLLN
jgi:hypothetical protein